MLLIHTFSYIFGLQMIFAEINCEYVPQHSEITKIDNGENLETVQPTDNEKESSLLKRRARFLGRLAFVIGAGNGFSTSNSSSSIIDFFRPHSPYVAAVYEPLLFNTHPYLSANLSSTTAISTTEQIILTTTNNNSVIQNTKTKENTVDQFRSNYNKHDEREEVTTEADVEILPTEETGSDDKKNDELFFQQDKNTTEEILTEKPKQTTHVPRPLPTSTRRTRTTTIKNQKRPVRPKTTQKPITPERPSATTTVTRLPETSRKPTTKRPVKTTENPFTTTTDEAFTEYPTFIPTFATPTTQEINNDNGTIVNSTATEFPGYYGGYPQNISNLEITTENNYYNDYSDIRDKFFNEKNEFNHQYELFDVNNNQPFESFVPVEDSFNGVHSFQQPPKIILHDNFNQNQKPYQQWSFDYQNNQFV